MILKRGLTPSIIFVSVLIFSGCAATKSGFVDNAYTLKDWKVCKNYLKDGDKFGEVNYGLDNLETQYYRALRKQVSLRNLSYGLCERLVSEHMQKVAAAMSAAGASMGETVDNMRANRAYSSPPPLPPTTSSNTYTPITPTTPSYRVDYAWDGFDGPNYQTIWKCRSKSTGQFASDASCYGHIKSDFTWPQN